MPKINYSKTIIYQLRCKTEKFPVCFFGHTTCLKKTRFYYKRDCENGREGIIYETIAKNGGFENWELVVIEPYPECSSKTEADARVEHIRITGIPQSPSQKPHKNVAFLEPNETENPEKNEKAIEPTHLASKTETENNEKICQYCDKIFTRKDNVIRHQKNYCKKFQNNAVNKCFELEKQVVQQRKQISKLKKQTKTESTELVLRPSVKTNTNTTNNNIINNIQNNIQNNIIIELGKENIQELLTTKQKLKILEKRYASLEYLIQYLHCNPKYPQFQCISIPSITKSHCNVYSAKHGKFISTKVNDTIDKLVGYRMDDIQTFLDETPDVPEKIEIAVKGLIEKMENDAKYKKDKCDKIRYDMYNNL